MISLKYFLRQIVVIITVSDLMNPSRGEINVTSYDHMPPLYDFEDYNECLHNSQSLYCMVYIEIIPDPNSLLWQQIDMFSNSYPFHYRHDHLFRGLCLNDVGHVNRNFTNWKFTTPRNQIFMEIFYDPQQNNTNLQYQDEIYNILNEQFNQEYNLSLQTLNLYCDNQEIIKEKDFGFKITIFICLMIITFNILSSLYDLYLRSQMSTAINNSKYYNGNKSSLVSRFLTTFSIYRNFCHLKGKNNSKSGKDLGFLDGFRTILSFLIVYEHSFYLQFVHLKNPLFFENLYHQYIMKFMLHGLVLVELFFVLSGLMLHIKMENGHYITKNSDMKCCLKVFGRLLFSRYMRYLPSLGFLILLNANLPQYFRNGPFWRFMMESNCYLCKKFWWKNVLMFNNFDISNSCLGHTWYIAADFQLYAFYLLILIFIAKYPKYKIWTYTIIAIFSAFVPVLINYLHKLDSIAYMKLESFRYFYLMDIETGSHLYLPSYTNLHGFLTGIICGDLYMKYFKQNQNFKQPIGNILKYSPYFGWPAIVGIFHMGTKLLWQKSTIWTALYGLLQRHVTVIILTVTTIMLMMPHKGIAYKILASLPFRVMARISYQVYLWHFIIVLIIASCYHQPINMSYFVIGTVVVLTYITANIVALILAITIEYPVAEILNLLKIK
ncbi:uncharacterized protein ACRADG_011781 isoform 2-T2 [Cochliomyia hominivorax]